MRTLIIKGNSSKVFDALVAFAEKFNLKAELLTGDFDLQPNSTTIKAMKDVKSKKAIRFSDAAEAIKFLNT